MYYLLSLHKIVSYVRRYRLLGYSARRSDKGRLKQLICTMRISGHVQPIGRLCGTVKYYAMGDVTAMDYRRLEWNWPHGTSIDDTQGCA